MRKGLIILGDLLDQDLIWLSQNGTIRTLTKGDRLIAEGEHVQNLFVITDGWLDVTVSGAPLARVSVGDILGEMSFVEKQGASATVTASEPARVLAVPQQALVAQFRVDEGFAARFYRALAVFLSDRLRSMAQGDGAEELDEGVLDSLHVAGDRMLRLIALLEGKAPH